MTAPTHKTTPLQPRIIARRLRLVGQVQGFGVRPTIVRLATRIGLVGHVGNTSEGVEILVQGDDTVVSRFTDLLLHALPIGTQIDDLHTESVGLSEFKSFQIPERTESDAGRIAAPIPQDLAMCESCRNEIAGHQSPRDLRRVDYAFTSCTNCGPRYSIIERMPYEREWTSMSTFAMCEECRAEYQMADDRRFHAQTNACRNCGPRLELTDAHGTQVARAEQAIDVAANGLRDGRIVAIKGLGGYQLLVRADQAEAVRRLRDRKRRCSKPVAVMVRDLERAKRIAFTSDAEERLLASSAAPIVLLRARSGVFGDMIADAVTCGMKRIGLMLPTTPLHWLLLDRTDVPLVCTSGNTEGVPLEHKRETAQHNLSQVADLFLHHDRPIENPIDDSVLHVIGGQPAIIRLARGYAPMRLQLPRELCDSARQFSAFGGHQKTAIAIWNGEQAVLGPHIGDLDTVASRERFLAHQDRLCQVYGLQEPELCCDLHPDYFTSTRAHEGQADPFRIQHHHAHVVAGMTQAGWLDREVLGVAFDGTGYGGDGTVWGGEFLRATASGFCRVAHLRPFTLIGGEKAVREPWRVATVLIAESSGIETAASYPFLNEHSQSLIQLIAAQAQRTTRTQAPGSITTTSAGRLFDAAACLVLGVERVDFEGQAAMLLESACDLSEHAAYDFGTDHSLDWRPVIRQILRDQACGVAPSRMAMKFHRGMAHAVTVICRKYAPLPVVLGGGVFQNQVLTELVNEQFATGSQPIAHPGMIPVNDGGLAVGQLVHGLARQKDNVPPRGSWS